MHSPPRLLSLLLAAPLLALGLLVPAAGPAAAAGIDGSVTKTYDVPTRDGLIHLEVVHPTSGGQIVKAPAILTYSPYSVLGRNGDADHWVPLGYARMYADVVGTGDSGGCYDYGGLREQRTGHDVVEWVGTQSWSTGKVGMLGGSYDGTTQYATAIQHPPHLTTIVPEAAISRWYGYAYSGGIRYTWTNEQFGNQGLGSSTDEGLDTPLAFDFGLAVPPPIDVDDPTWAERVQDNVTPCDEIAHTTHGYSDQPTYDDFWFERDYVAELHDVTIPVLVASNWGDWNVKQEEGVHAFKALVNSENRRMYFGTRWQGHGTPPGAAYDLAVDKWFAHYLQGVDNGIESSLPRITTQTSDAKGPIGYTPAPTTTPVKLYAQHTAGDYAWAIKPALPPATGQTVAASFPITNANTETRAGSQYRTNAGWLAFETPVLSKDVRIFGSPTVRVWSTVARDWVTVTPSLLDVDPANYTASTTTDAKGVVAFTRGWRDTRYTNDGRSAGEPASAVNGKPFGADVELKPTDYTVRAGHKIVLMISTETAEWATPKPYACSSPGCPTYTMGYDKGQTYLTLPLAGDVSDPGAIFGGPSPVVPEVPVPALLPLVAAGLLALVVAGRRSARGAVG